MTGHGRLRGPGRTHLSKQCNRASESISHPMTSTATAGYMQMNHPHSMGPPMGGPMGHPGYNHMAQMQQQQQQQQGGPMGGPSQMQHGPGPNQMGMPNQWQGMYQGPHPGQQMYGPQGGYPGQERPGFMPPHGMQAPPQQQPTQAPAPAKKPSKRKSNQQKHQEAVAAMQANTSNAAPPPKQAFLNPMGGPPVGFNGNSNFPGGAQPNQMGNHLSPYHPHSQHAQQAQMQAMHDWNRQHAMASAASANRAGANSNSRNEPAIRGDVRSKLHASIHSRQNASPQQMAAMMSPNDLAAAASGRYPPGSTGANAGNSISPPTMMSPPRINQVPQNPGHAASNYGPQSVPNPPSMPSEQNHHAQQQQGQGQQGHPMFSPKMQPPQGFYHQNGHSQMTNGFMGASGQGNHNGVVPGMTHLQNQNELPQVTLEDCKAILQETDFADFDSISFDMTNKQGFEFNYDESRTLLQRILS
uniref:MamL-1 domain-containing protein n=1 Tax=Panagrellus redivivus TaxID=6233 RepID=A0A7E4WAU9_PANRE